MPSFSAMDTGMALRAERFKLLFGVVARVAAKLFVVDLQVRLRAARLTPPAVAMQDLLPQPLVRRRIQPQAGRGSGRTGLMMPNEMVRRLIHLQGK
jgi:hypothetical protein